MSLNKLPPSLLYINGQFVDALDGSTSEVLNPYSGQVLTTTALASERDVDLAVEAAKNAFPAWSALEAAERGKLLYRLADELEKRSAELAELETLNTGHPIRDTSKIDVPRSIDCFRYFAGIADKIEGSVVPVQRGFLNYVKRVPIGVVGQIAPWNFPLLFVSWKLGPALAAGNTVVYKPSELTPLTALKVAEVMNEVGFPPGVVNMVPGLGERAGQRIVDHPDVPKLSFTGSTRVGKSIAASAAANLKKVQLELGGKGANIVFEDADLDAAVQGAALAVFQNQGQACVAGSRLFLQESIADEFLSKLMKVARGIRLGNPMEQSCEMGPLTSKLHQSRVLEHIEVAKREGGHVLIGGRTPQEELLRAGFFIEPTIVEVQSGHTIAREEVFGPVLSVLRFSDESEAVRLANDSEYGLASGVWTNDLSRAHRVADLLNTGMCWVNCYKKVAPASPFGGMKASGYGREMGFEAVHSYTELKSTWINVSAAQSPFYQAN